MDSSSRFFKGGSIFKNLAWVKVGRGSLVRGSLFLIFYRVYVFYPEMEVGRGSGGSRKWMGLRGSWVSFLPEAVGHGGSWVTQLWVRWVVGHSS